MDDSACSSTAAGYSGIDSQKPTTTEEPSLLLRLSAPGDNPRTKAFRKKHYPETTSKEWNDWRWQASHRLKTLADMERVLVLSPSERAAIERGGTMLPLGMTPYYASLIDPEDPQDALRKTVVPTM